MKTITKFTCPLYAALALACFAVLSTVQAVTPAPDGGYPALNTAEGDNALFSLTTGGGNTATGFNALYFNTTGNYNTAEGTGALFSNTTGSANTAVGLEALFSNTIGFQNTATGHLALFSNTTGTYNTANGLKALFSNTTGTSNTATGLSALFSNTTGPFNTANGYHALANKTTGNSNIALGYCAGCQRDASENNIDIGNIGGSGFEENTIRIGTVVAQGDCLGQLHRAHTSTYIAGISGQTASGGVAVYVNADGKVGTLTSSARFKQDIHGMDKASEALLSLRPVTFRYKKNIDSKGAPQFGLVAEEVEKVNPDLVVRDKEGKPHSVRYDAVNAMLLNEFLKEHRTVQKQGATIGQLKSMVEKQEAANAQQQKQIEALTMGLQKVSAQLEASKPAPQMVNNP